MDKIAPLAMRAALEASRVKTSGDEGDQIAAAQEDGHSANGPVSGTSGNRRQVSANRTRGPRSNRSNLGLLVKKQSLGNEIAGQIVRDSWRNGNTGRSGFTIYINSDQHPNRQRFTLAHEIAHYILHRDLIEDGLIDDTMYRSSLSNFYETQANRMAADYFNANKIS